MDAGSEGFIEVADTVCRQEEDAGIVLEHAKKDCSRQYRRARSTIGTIDIPATIPLREKSSLVLAARNTSASSSNRIQPHLLAKAKLVSRVFSTSLAVVPKSPTSHKRSDRFSPL